MRCDTSRPLIDAAVDGELDAVHALDVERHLEQCPDCAAERDRLVALRASLANAGLRYAAPSDLLDRFRAEIQPRSPAWFRSVIRHRAIAASLLAALTVGLIAGRLTSSGQSESGITSRELVDAHVRSLLASHLTDVTSTDQHTVKPWFAGKLDYAPPVIDLAEDGFPLVGGRLDYLQGRPVAALVYRRRGHAINVYVLPARSDRPSTVRVTVHQGYHLEQWSRQGMQFWAISDVGPEDLAKFVAALQAAT